MSTRDLRFRAANHSSEAHGLVRVVDSLREAAGRLSVCENTDGLGEIKRLIARFDGRRKRLMAQEKETT